MIVQSDVVASNGMIHIINKLMDSVAPTVDSEPEVRGHQKDRDIRTQWNDSY